MSRYPDARRPPARKKPAPAPKKKQPVRKSAPQKRRHSLLLYLWIALALPELVLHLSTAKSNDLLLNSGLLLGPVFAFLPACLMFALCTSLPAGARITSPPWFTALSASCCAPASWCTTGSSAPSTPSTP